MSERLVVLGNSAAALAAVRAYRAHGGKGRVTLVSRETCPAYSPVLTTYYLRDQIGEAAMYVCDAAMYEEHGVETRFGCSVTGLDTDARSVGLDDGRTVRYDALLIATGASPRRLEGLGDEVAAEVCYLRTLADARRIREKAGAADHVVVVGGGLVSLQVAAALARPGRRVTGVVSSGQLLSQNVDETAAGIIQDHLERQAPISFRFGATVAETRRDGTGLVLGLDDGAEVRADLVVVGKGVAPNLDFVEGTPVRVGRGILVDEHLRTTAEHVYAAGDVSEGVNRLTGRPEPVPTWTSACEQGRAAGMNLAGRTVSYEGSLPENVTTFFGLKVASLGLVHSDDPGLRELSLADEGRGRYRKLVFRGDRLVGALLVGDIEDAGVLRGVIAAGDALGVAPEEALRVGVSQGDRVRACLYG